MVIRKEDLTRDRIIAHVRSVYQVHFAGNGDTELVEAVFEDIIDLFSGKMEGYQKCDTRYHDLYHTLQVIPPFAEILSGWNKSGNAPWISKYYFDLGLVSVLLHDTGYIKSNDDHEGTGGKYTFEHIQRSIDFAAGYLRRVGFEEQKIASVRNIIMCTGVRVDYSGLLFGSDEERIVGYALGTSDLIGQMSDVDYPEKLPALYSEFEEAYRYEGMDRLRNMGIVIFKGADDLIRSTPDFYEVVVKDKFWKMGSLDAYLEPHYGNYPNPYKAAMEDNIRRIKLASAWERAKNS